MTDSVEKSETPKINKTGMIRDIIAKNPSAMPSDIVKELAEKGIKVTNSFVSVTKSRTKNPSKKKVAIAAGKRRRKAPTSNVLSAKKARRGSNRRHNNQPQPMIENMLLVKGLTEKMSIDDIIAAANAVKKLFY